MKNAFLIRTYQFFFRGFYTLMRKKRQRVYQGREGYDKMASSLRKAGYVKPLLVSDLNLARSGALAPLFACLEKVGYSFATYMLDGNSEADEEDLIKARIAYREGNCDFVIALGGGSAMDVGKGLLALLTPSGYGLGSVAGLLRVHGRSVPLCCIPSTAGTGSEATPAAVILSLKGQKKIIMTPKIVPDMVVLDPLLLKGLPKKSFAYSALDALSHAVESSLSVYGRKKEREEAHEAIGIIYRNLKPYLSADSFDEEAASNLLYASYLAGRAFGTNMVGAAHALAHAVGGSKHLPHGLLTGYLLPYVVTKYGPKAFKALAECYDAAGLRGASSLEQKATAFIDSLYEMFSSLGLEAPRGVMDSEEAKRAAEEAYKEATPLYPLARLLKESEYEAILNETKITTL